MSPRSASHAALDLRLIQGLVPRLRIFWGVAPASLGPLMKQCWVLAAPRGTSWCSAARACPAFSVSPTDR